jgi:excisionase family DNA binding protein
VKTLTPALPRLKTIQSVASETGISVFTIRRLIDRGDLRVVRLPGIRRLYIADSDARQALATWTRESQQ